MTRAMVSKLQYIALGSLIGFLVGHGVGAGIFTSARADKRALRSMLDELQREHDALKTEHVDREAVVGHLREKAASEAVKRAHLRSEATDEKLLRIAHEHALHDALNRHAHEHADLENSEEDTEAPDKLANDDSDDASARSLDEARRGKESEQENEAKDSAGDASEDTDDGTADLQYKEPPLPHGYEVNGLDLPKARAQNRTIIVVPANLGYIEFALNIICSFRALRISNYVLLAMDKDVLSEFVTRSLPVYADPGLPFITSKSAQWAEANFHKLVCTKLVPVTNLLKAGLHVILSDADIVWRKNPFAHLRWDLSLTFSIGSCHKSLRDNADLSKDKVAKLNTGFYFAQSDPSVIKLFERAYGVCKRGSLTGDQPAINTVIHQDLTGHDRMQYTYGFFDGCLFANGCVYFKHLCANDSKSDPFIVHANFLVGRKKKIKSLAKSDLWNLRCHPNPDQYSPTDRPKG
ncbi:Beta-arabinofuranosyltransferase RAY1 [Diplonema papillatum]|nr:Beta-arabinofuranosyltransferase RAY1 [Diplonema papillatum]|eukprot:gene23022-35273_t